MTARTDEEEEEKDPNPEEDERAELGERKWERRRSRRGMQKAAVLPDPVRAMTT